MSSRYPLEEGPEAVPLINSCDDLSPSRKKVVRSYTMSPGFDEEQTDCSPRAVSTVRSLIPETVPSWSEALLKPLRSFRSVTREQIMQCFGFCFLGAGLITLVYRYYFQLAFSKTSSSVLWLEWPSCAGFYDTSLGLSKSQAL